MRPERTFSSREEPPSAIERVLGHDQLGLACSTAVDPLEIAAQMEAAGLSSQVVAESYGFPDVFSLAQAVYRQVPFRTPEPPATPRPAGGSVADLLRGLLYALPTLLFTAAMAGFSVKAAWWALPVGLTTGWGLSQAAAAIGWAWRGRGDDPRDAWLASASLLLAVGAAGGLALIATYFLEGRPGSTLAAVGLAVYITMSGILLLQKAERLLAVCLVPGAIGAVLAHVGGPVAITPRAGSWSVVVSVGLVVLTAHRTAFSGGWRRPRLVGSDLSRGLHYLLIGTSCASVTSAVIGFGAAAHARGGTLAIAVWPLLLTLGVMEWQIHSFRGRGAAALSTTTGLGPFARAGRRAFLTSCAIYAALLADFSLLALVVGEVRHAVLLPLLLAAEGLLGVAFFLGMILQSSTRPDLTLHAWAVSLTALAIAIVATLARDGRVTPVMGLVECMAATGLTCLILAARARPVVSSPLSYQ